MTVYGIRPKAVVPAAALFVALAGVSGAGRAGGVDLISPALAAAPVAEEHSDQPSADVPDLNLAVDVDDGRPAAGVGDELTYTARIRNAGTGDARRLTVTQTLPGFARFVSVDHDGAVEDGGARWSVDVPAGAETLLTARAKVTGAAPGVLRLATVVCVSDRPDGRPLVCATDSDELPTASAGGGAGSGRSDRAGLWLVALLAAGGSALLGGTGLVLRRRSAGVTEAVPRHAARSRDDAAADPVVPAPRTGDTDAPAPTAEPTDGPGARNYRTQ